MNIRQLILEVINELEDSTDPSTDYYGLTAKEKYNKACMDEANRWKAVLEQKPYLYREVLQRIKDTEEYSNVQNILSNLLNNKITKEEAGSLQDYVAYNVENFKSIKDALLKAGYRKVV